MVEKQLSSIYTPLTVRRLLVADIPQSEEIEREAFPTLSPPTNFQRELENRIASYIVAVPREGALAEYRRTHSIDGHRLSHLLQQTVRSIGIHHGDGKKRTPERIAGFLGTWYMVDEAHVVSIAVRKRWRSKGIGELLLLCAIDEAISRGSSVVTLEVRPSNLVARRLYLKYGLVERGVRKGYYVDNREDAIIMTSENIQNPAYAGMLRQNREAHASRWGKAEVLLS